MTAGDMGLLGAIVGLAMALVKVVEKSVVALIAKRNGNGNGSTSAHKIDLLNKDLAHWHMQQMELTKRTLELIEKNMAVMDRIDRRLEKSGICPRILPNIRAIGDENG